MSAIATGRHSQGIIENEYLVANVEEQNRTAYSPSNLETLKDQCRSNKGMLLSRIRDRIAPESHEKESSCRHNSCHDETEKAWSQWIRSGSEEEEKDISKVLAMCVISNLQELEGQQSDRTKNISPDQVKQMPSAAGRPIYVDTDPTLCPFPSTVTRHRFGKTLPRVPRRVCIAEISILKVKGPAN